MDDFAIELRIEIQVVQMRIIFLLLILIISLLLNYEMTKCIDNEVKNRLAVAAPILTLWTAALAGFINILVSSNCRSFTFLI